MQGSFRGNEETSKRFSGNRRKYKLIWPETQKRGKDLAGEKRKGKTERRLAKREPRNEERSEFFFGTSLSWVASLAPSWLLSAETTAIACLLSVRCVFYGRITRSSCSHNLSSVLGLARGSPAEGPCARWRNHRLRFLQKTVRTITARTKENTTKKRKSQKEKLNVFLRTDPETTGRQEDVAGRERGLTRGK